MYIKNLALSNYRGFQELTLEIPRDLCVFIGVNGSGKSTVLDSIALLLKFFVYALKRKFSTSKEPFPVELISGNDITLDRGSMALNIIVQCDQSAIALDESISWEISFDKSTIDKKHYIESKALIKYIKSLENYLLSEINANMPILVNYKADRVFQLESAKSTTASNEREYIYKQLNLFEARQPPQLLAYDNAFVSGTYIYQNFEDWFRVQEDYENERKLRENSDYKNPRLEMIRTALERFFSDFTNVDFSGLRIVRILNHDEVRFTHRSIQSSLVISKNDQDLRVEQLSDGERMCILMVADIARRLAIANPDSNIEALQGNGIILINEIEAHLHPQWQREIIPSLRKTFPNCQFIITTHSPQVLSNIPNQNIFILEDFQVLENTPPNYGRDSNSILYDLMNVTKRPQYFQDKVNQCFELIDENKLDEAKEILKQLEANFGERDTDIIRAKSQIEFTKQLDEID